MATAIKSSTSLKKTDNKIIMGQGAYGIVYKDIWNGRKVAVKRIQLIQTTSKREEDAMHKLDHRNVVKLLHVKKDEDFKYYVLEFCQASLEKLFLKDDDPKKYRGPMSSKNQVCLQLAKGLAYIHEKKLIHRDLKPQNVLICVQSNRKEVTMKWADFGLSRPVNERGTFTMSGIRGTFNWYAPEILDIMEEDIDNSTPPQRGTIKSDVFAEGLVFGYYLLGGQHPYGPKPIMLNIQRNNPVNLNGITEWQPIHDIITEMLKTNPDERISSSDVVSKISNIEGEDKSLVNPSNQLDYEKILSNWDEYLAPAPMGIAIMSQLLICASRVIDFAINGEIDKKKINLLKHPESFYRTLVQIANESYETFMLAHTNMDKIQLQMTQDTDYVIDSINIIESEKKTAIEKFMSINIKRFKKADTDRSTLSQQVCDAFHRLGRLIQQVILAIPASKGARTEEIKELILQAIEQEKHRQEEYNKREQDLLQKEMEGAQKAVQRTQNNLEEAFNFRKEDVMTLGTTYLVRNTTSWLRKNQAENRLHRLKQEAKQVEKERDKICNDVGKAADEMIQLLEEGTEQLCKLHENWAGMIMYFEQINNYIDQNSVDFVGHAELAKETSNLTLLQVKIESIEKLLYSFVTSRHIAATYVKVSNNYIMKPLIRMHGMLSIESHKLEETQGELLESCYKAMKGIQDMGNKDRNQMIREIENEVQSIQN